MIKKPVRIMISDGLDARPIAMLVQVANQFESEIFIESGTRKINAKSIMGMMTLGLDTGESVTVSADGTDEEAAMKMVEAYLTDK